MSTCWGRALRLCARVTLIACLVHAAAAIADGQDGPTLSRWKRLVVDDIEAVGDVSDGHLRQAVSQIMTFREALKALYPGMRLTSPVLTRLVVFPSHDSFVRFSPRDDRGRPQESVGGYFTARADLNLMVLGGRDLSLLFHEFAHHVLNRNFHSLPGWLDEGLAEFFSTFEADWQNARSLVGRAPAHRLLALRSDSFIPLRQVLFASPAEMEKLWRNPERISLFYAESWALVHYLMLGRGNPKAFTSYVHALERGTPPEKAFLDAFGDVEAVQRELLPYVRRFTSPAIAFNMIKPSETKHPVARMPESDAQQLQGDLLLGVGALEEAERVFATAIRLDPKHFMARMGLAQLAAARDDLAGSIASLTELAAAAPDNFAANYNLASILTEAGRHQDAIPVHERALKLNAESAGPWVDYSLSLLALRRIAPADAAMQRALQLHASPGWYRGRAYAALRLGLDEIAASDAEEYLKRSGGESESSSYTGFVGAIANRRMGRKAQADAILERVRAVTPEKSWTTTVLDYLQGRMPAKDFLSRARSNGEKTEAHTYIGFTDAIAGRIDDALTHFRWVRDNGAKNYVEYGMAKGEMRRLENALTTKSGPEHVANAAAHD